MNIVPPDFAAWPRGPSWGFAAVVLALMSLAVVGVWAANYWEAFGARRPRGAPSNRQAISGPLSERSDVALARIVAIDKL